jgi:phosphatidylethanolamine/phosphatidyl-N-methylethanolamine N-methyltransferase
MQEASSGGGAPVRSAGTACAENGRPNVRADLFLKRWLANPLRMGSIVPSSEALCRLIVREAWPSAGKAVLELGAGTGAVSRALLECGLDPSQLILVEIEPSMAAHLRAGFPGVEVIQGDARALPAILPERFTGRIASVICGIPLVLLPREEQRGFIDAIGAVAPDEGFLHYSYCVTSPLSARRHGLIAKREAWTPINFPPASVWRYRRSRSF